jgi:hypothetical protein
VAVGVKGVAGLWFAERLDDALHESVPVFAIDSGITVVPEADCHPLEHLPALVHRAVCLRCCSFQEAICTCLTSKQAGSLVSGGRLLMERAQVRSAVPV